MHDHYELPYIDMTCVLYMYVHIPRRVVLALCIVVYIHYHMTTQPHWPYMDIPCYIHNICLVYVCMYTPQSVFNIVYNCVHTLSHDYTTALTIYGYVCTHTLQKDFNIVFLYYHMTIHYHVSIYWVIANQRAVLTSRDSQQPIRDQAPTWRRMGVYFTLYILLMSNLLQ